MNFSLTDVEQLEDQVKAWTARGTTEAVDALAAAEMNTVRAEHNRGKLKLATPQAFEAYEAEWRHAYDKHTFETGLKLEIDVTTLAQRIAADMSESERLKSLAEQYGLSTQAGLTAAVLDELQQQRVKGELAGRTRAELLESYAKWDDEADSARVRFLESAVLQSTLDQFGVRDDPDTDGSAVLHLREAVRTRRGGRIPPWMNEAHARVQQAWTRQHQDTLAHLRSGRGIASRPRVA